MSFVQQERVSGVRGGSEPTLIVSMTASVCREGPLWAESARTDAMSGQRLFADHSTQAPSLPFACAWINSR
jgi:hypothetical protein